MEWWQAIILGIVQGLTEFLPVSSSGHLLLLQDVMNVQASGDALDAFDVALHAGTLVALFAYFGSDLWAMAGAWFQSIRTRTMATPEARLAWLILLGTIPALVFFAVAGDFIDAAQENMTLIASMLIGVSFVFIIAERFKGERSTDQANWRDALAIGCAQALALIPGTSRSGATISMGMLLGFDRTAAARFSFLLSAPVITAALVKTTPELAHVSQQDTGFLIASIAGFVASAVSGYLAVSYLIKFLGNNSLSWFAGYRIPVGMFFLWYFSAR